MKNVGGKCMSSKHPPKLMNEEIKKYPIFIINTSGRLIKTNKIKSTNDYSHQCNLHHYIPYSDYERNKQWYIERGIEQKLILMSIPLHEQLHFQAIKNLTDEEFKAKYKISRYELIFNKRYSNYKEVKENERINGKDNA